MRLVDHPEVVAALPEPTADAPWRILISGCMAGWGCGVDATSYGMESALRAFQLPTCRLLPYCPEDVGLGTPRTMPDLHGGDGAALLRGEARVLDEHGADLTEGMLVGARAMVAFARHHRVHLAILTDASAACGTQVISLGCRFDRPRRLQRGMGVAATSLSQAGIPVVAQRDHHTLGLLLARLQPGFSPDPAAVDHHESAWVREHLPEPGGRCSWDPLS